MPRKKQKTINLLIKREQEATFSSQFLAWSFTYGRYIIIITQIVVLSVFFARFKLDRDHVDLKESLSQKQAIVESMSDLENEIRRLQTKTLHIKQILVNQDLTIKALRFLEDNSPTETVFSSLSINNEKITITATAKNLRNFIAFISMMQKSNKFSEVTLEAIDRKSDGKVDFKIGANLVASKFNE